MSQPMLNIQLQMEIHSGCLKFKTSFSRTSSEKQHRHLLELLREVRRLRPRSIVIQAPGLHEVRAIAQLLLTILKSALPHCQLEIVEEAKN